MADREALKKCIVIRAAHPDTSPVAAPNPAGRDGAPLPRRGRFNSVIELHMKLMAGLQ